MNYIYDTYLNFNKKLYDFYEWNKNDKLIHIRKIPAFKINDKTLLDFKKNLIKVDKDFLNKIYYKTEEFKESKINKLKYTVLFCNGKNTIAVKFNKNGINYMKSTLIIDEECDITNIIKNQKETDIKYKVLKIINKNNFKTRFENENYKFITNELDKILKNNDYEKINYICLECFGKKESNIKEAINRIKKEITKENDNFYKIFKIFKLINQNN